MFQRRSPSYQNKKISVVVFDFDQTIVDAHTSGHEDDYYGSDASEKFEMDAKFIATYAHRMTNMSMDFIMALHIATYSRSPNKVRTILTATKTFLLSLEPRTLSLRL